jgi:hypothetical protein
MILELKIYLHCQKPTHASHLIVAKIDAMHQKFFQIVDSAGRIWFLSMASK